MCFYLPGIALKVDPEIHIQAFKNWSVYVGAKPG